MLFRLLTLSASLLVVLGLITEVIWPALRNRALFPLFRGESRLARAERFRIEALERKRAAEREAEAVRVETEVEKLDSELINELTKTERKDTRA